jgi:hypothetical protein
MKTPIAIMRQSLEPLKRLVPSSERAGPARHRVIENSIERLDQLVSSRGAWTRRWPNCWIRRGSQWMCRAAAAHDRRLAA